MQVIFGMIAGILVTIAYIWYCRAIFKGTTRPSRMTWFIIALESWIILFAYQSLGADTTIWAPLGEALVVSVVAILCVKRGVGGTEKTDIICLVGAVASLLLWWVFHSSLLGLIASLLVDTFALWPTIKKSWKRPKEEDLQAWTLTQIGNGFNLLALDQIKVGVLLYPIWRFILDGVMIYALYKKRK